MYSYVIGGLGIDLNVTQNGLPLDNKPTGSMRTIYAHLEMSDSTR
jgi:hypothetical protein